MGSRVFLLLASCKGAFASLAILQLPGLRAPLRAKAKIRCVMYLFRQLRSCMLPGRYTEHTQESGISETAFVSLVWLVFGACSCS
jgi:hypothetical protein